MKKFITIVLFVIFVCCLGGCGFGLSDATSSATDNANAETQSARISALSAKLDQYEAALENVDYGSSVRKALKAAQKAENSALDHQGDTKLLWVFGWDGDKEIADFQVALNKLQNAMNSDKRVRESIERQNTSDAVREQTGIFGDAWKKMLIIALIIAAILVVIILALSVLRKSGKKQKVKEVTRQPEPATKPEPEVIDVEASEVHEVDTTSRQANLLETSRARFNRECEQLGHDPEEVLAYFDGDEKKAKVYISMEVNLKNQGGDKNYKQIYEEATA